MNWGLRDYGLGVWEGGDPACDHRTRDPETVAKMEASSGLTKPDGATGGASQQHRAWPGGICGRCGALRIAPTVWDGDPSCTHVWETVVKPAANGMVFSKMLDRREGGSLNNMSATRKPNTSQFCARCGAWRGSLGLEPTVELYVKHIVDVFREVRRVLRPDGTLWLNMGDCYHSGDRGGYQNTRTANDSLQRSNPASDFVGAPNRIPQAGLKDKDLVGLPWMVAFALRGDGWWLRSPITWAKGISFLPGYSGSVMPESIRDRPTRAYEMVFLLAKNGDYFCDMDAIREPYSEGTYDRLMQPTFDEQGGGAKDYRDGTNPSRSVRKAAENLRRKMHRDLDRTAAGGKAREAMGRSGWHTEQMRRDIGRDELGLRTAERMGHGPGWRARQKTAENPHAGGRRQALEPGEPNAFHPLGRNVRDVWAINPEPFDYEMCRACKRVYDGREYAMLADAPRDNDAPPRKICRCGRFDEWLSHFAVFPQALVLPCVLAGTSERGCCSRCGNPWERVTVAEGGTIGQAWHPHANDDAEGQRSPNTLRDSQDGSYKRVEIGWRPSCRCGIEETVPATVLDPFAGSGTTLLVAAKNGRASVGVELQSDYIPLIRKRLEPLETDLIHPVKVVIAECPTTDTTERRRTTDDAPPATSPSSPSEKTESTVRDDVTG